LQYESRSQVILSNSSNVVFRGVRQKVLYLIDGIDL